MAAPRTRSRVSSIATVLAVLAVTFGALLAATPYAAAVTYVSRAILADTTWGSSDTVYVITSWVTVRPGVTLTILPGVEVRVDPARMLFVEGRLVADGTSASPIQWVWNNTIVLFPPQGVQFNASATGSVSWNTFDRFDRPLMAVDSSPRFSWNTITSANLAIGLQRSSATVTDNTITKSAFGIMMSESSPQVLRNSIDGGFAGIQAMVSGAPRIANNVITNITQSSFSVGIYTQRGVTADLWWNTLVFVQGARGNDGASPGLPGGAGGAAAGILVDGAPSATVTANTVNMIAGGRGGDGAANAGGTGGLGGAGGGGAAILIANTPSVSAVGNIISNVYGGRGGNGGGGGSTAVGADGGNGGGAAGIETLTVSSATRWESNSINGITGGGGGNGGDGTGPDGRGGFGGEADGAIAIDAMDGNAWGNFIFGVRGGYGGNSTAVGLGNNHGGDGGPAVGLGLTAAAGASQFLQNTLWQVTGGVGGRGANAGSGGNATGGYTIGKGDGTFNLTSTRLNNALDIAGGAGGVGTRMGGAGGGALGLAAALVTPTFDSNAIRRVTGGRGGDALDGTDGGRGGDAAGATAFVVSKGWSSRDVIDTVAKGAVGAGPPAQPSTALGWALFGDATVTTGITIENGTLAGTGDLDLQVNDFVDATTINTSFSESRLAIASNSTLTVKNYLGVGVFWPDGATRVTGASIRVEDEGSPVWDFVSPTGDEAWLLATDRIYEGAIPARDNRTEVFVAYLSYAFANEPRTVDMAAGNTQAFVIIDGDAPTATASPLPAYENSATFNVGYTATDGSGVGVGNVTLWWRKGGAWNVYATQPGGATGTFSFTASAGDGVYEFAATADDLAGNTESNPGNSNESWTALDTVRPTSHVDPQPTYRNTATFLVTWAPDGGVTDIAGYEIQYNHAGGGWTLWLVVGAGTTSATFTANPAWGVYEFRSKAVDVAGNYEIPSGNDTWTIVDTEPPASTVVTLTPYQTSLTFPVSWTHLYDNFDIATFRVEVKDDGGSWAVWIASTANRTASFAGVDGHTYAFQSIATDYAGNVEAAKTGNDTWTHVDVSPPDSAVTALPQYATSPSWTLDWGPVAGTTDIAIYTVQYRDNGGAWTSVPGAVATNATTANFALGVDGHTYAFRSLAVDRAGNGEAVPATNDTWIVVDTTRPSVLASAPRGTGTNMTPIITVTFSEGMDRASVEGAFSLTPDVNGGFTWSADSRTVTFIPARALTAGTDYTVAVGPSAKDFAGNTMASPATFQFTTAAAPPGGTGGPGGGVLGDWWWLIAVIAAAVVGALFVAMRMLRAKPEPPPVAAKKESQATIDDVFLLYHDGILIKHETRRLKPDIDTDILSGMLTAVQSFVKDSFRTEEGELDELTFGAMSILIGRGKWLILAAMIQGDGKLEMREQIEKCVEDMESHHPEAIEKWDGNMSFAKVLSPYIKKLIRGEYT